MKLKFLKLVRVSDNYSHQHWWQ